MGDRRSYYSENYTSRYSSSNYSSQQYTSNETRSNSYWNKNNQPPYERNDFQAPYPPEHSYQQNRQFSAQGSSYSKQYQEGESRPYYENKMNSQASFASNRRFMTNTYPEPGYRGRPDNSTYRSNEQTTAIKTANFPEERGYKNPYKYVSPNYANKNNSDQTSNKPQSSYSMQKHEENKEVPSYAPTSPSYSPLGDNPNSETPYTGKSMDAYRIPKKQLNARFSPHDNKEEFSHFKRSDQPLSYYEDDEDYNQEYDNPEDEGWDAPNEPSLGWFPEPSGTFQKNVGQTEKRRLFFLKQQKASKKFKPKKRKGVFNKEGEGNANKRAMVKENSVLEKFEKEKKMVKYEEIETTEDQIEHINARSAPLLKMPYVEQLKLKHEEGKVLMSQICSNMSNENPKVKEWLEEQSAANNGEAYKMHEVIHKETDYNHYKSRVELVIGLDPLTEQPTAGMRCGTNGVAPLTDDLLTMPQCIIPHIRVFEKFLKQSSVKICAKHGGNDGAWKQLSFKVGFKTNQIMMIVGFTSLKMINDRIGVAKTELRRFYSSDEGKGITSLYFQLIRQRPKGGPSFHMNFLMGEHHIEEIFNGVRFKIGPASQVPNSQWSAELVKDTVKKMGRVTEETAVIDIASPLATVSLCLAKECKAAHYLVAHIPVKAKDSLQATAPDNGITNWGYSERNIPAHVQNVAKKLLQTKGATDALIYIDPWSSIRFKAVNAIRHITNVKRLLFLTCGKKFMLEAFSLLVQEDPKFVDEDVYVPVEAAVIDSYPHTTNMSMFVLLERLSVAKQRLLKTTDDNNKESS